jgi:hypothetical protein
MDDGLLFFLPHTWTMASSSFLPLNAVSKQQLTSALKLVGSFFGFNRPTTHGSWPSFGARTNFSILFINMVPKQKVQAIAFVH